MILQKIFNDKADTNHYNIKVVLTTPKQVEIKASFKASEDVIVYEDAEKSAVTRPSGLLPKKFVEVKTKEITKTINPVVIEGEIEKQEVFLAQVRIVSVGWKVAAQFRITLRPEKMSKQEAWVERENRDVLYKQVSDWEDAFSINSRVLPEPAFDKMPIKEILRKMYHKESKLKRIEPTKISKFVDTNFLPVTQNCSDVAIDSNFQIVFQWRRPKEFNPEVQHPKVFSDHQIAPRDVVPGILGDEWFLSAVSILAAEPRLIKRLFETPEYNEEGIYRIKLCKNGRWQSVTVDELIPCYAKGGPVFA